MALIKALQRRGIVLDMSKRRTLVQVLAAAGVQQRLGSKGKTSKNGSDPLSLSCKCPILNEILVIVGISLFTHRHLLSHCG